MFPVDLMVQAVLTDPMDQCHLGVQRDQEALSAQKDLLVLVSLVALLGQMVLEIQQVLYHPEVLATQMVPEVLGSQKDPAAQVGNLEVRWVQMDQADLRVQENLPDQWVLSFPVVLAVQMVLIGLLDQLTPFHLWFPSNQCLLADRLVLLVPETRVVPVDLALP